jgi:mRNA interferase MazF
VTWPLARGHVVLADVNLDEPKLFVVVSNNRRNQRLPQVLAARLTTSPKPNIPSIVELSHPEVFVGRVICDDIVEIYENEVLEVRSALSPRAMRAVGMGLAAALDLNI